MLPSCQPINHRPEMILGLDSLELVTLAGVSIATAGGTAPLVTAVIGLSGFIFPAAMVISATMIWQGALLLRHVKRQRPHGYYRQWLMVRAAAAGLSTGPVALVSPGPHDPLRHDHGTPEGAT